MNTVLNIGAFVRVARLGSISAAARELDAVTSVIAKRISQLEKEVGAALIARSTRGVTLTAAGEQYLPYFVRLMAAHDEIFQDMASNRKTVQGFINIITPPTITSMFIGQALINFQLQNHLVDMDITLMERSVNPLEEGYDLALGAWPTSYPNVVDVPLCPYELVTVCSPSYLKTKPRPRHPTDLVDHQCLSTSLFRSTWGFTHARGTMTVEVHSRIQSSDSRMVRDAVRMGLGVAILSRMLVEDELRSGALVPLLEEFPVAPYWVKLLVPRVRMNRPAVRALVAFLKEQIRTVDATP
ncbi:MAG TPA: LysR family transcriptional regulator [Steroidobacteraceae bacterium]|nr:LysR family transcriptional regulator [Steroidobacteraceae bacterium]